MKQWRLTKILTCLLLVMLLTVSLSVPVVFAAGDKTAAETLHDMGIGWNLGNTLEACGSNQTTVQGYETSWGNIVTTQALIDGIKAAGFKTVRIPVAWSNLMTANYTINPDLLKRVKEVADYCSKAGMYAIVNIHWDNGWFANFSTNYDESMKKYTAIWTQISNYFKDYPDNLILESLNEEGAWDDIWNRYSGTPADGKSRAYGILNNINQKFVDIVRASGGINASRCLLIAGYGTDIDLTCDSLFKMPADTIKSKLMVSVHYYTPSTFTILEQDASWGKSAYTWGTDAEKNQVKTDFNKVKSKFTNNGIPVVVGEYGSTKINKDPNSVRLYISTVCQTAYDLGLCPVLWDPGTHFSRSEGKFSDTQLAPIFLKYKQADPTKIGDVNGDGTIDALDFALMKSYLVGSISDFPVANDLEVSDVNGDREFNALDFAAMKQYLLGIITKFPAQV